MIWDPEATKTISAATHVSRITHTTSFEGVELKGLPAKVFLRGRLAAQNGEVLPERRLGHVHREKALPRARPRARDLSRALTGAAGYRARARDVVP